MHEKDIIIEPRRAKKEKVLPKRALLVANPSEAESAFQIFKPYTDEIRTVLQDRIAVDKDRRLCLAGPALGSPAAALILEKLIVLGVKEIMLVSCCGSLDPAHSIGDIMIGTGAVSGEGVSPYYAEKSVVLPAPEAVDQLQMVADALPSNVHRGTIWSTDAPYRERRSELLRLQERHGIVGVDMEFSALCSVASFRKVVFGGIFVVSDTLWTRNWKPGFGGADFRAASRGLIEQLIHRGVSSGPERGE